MHEFSLINDLMRKIANIAKEQKAQKVTKVTVRLGALAHISASHFREHFEEAARGTVADGAGLDVLVSTNINDPHAQDILLESVDVAD